MGLIASYMGIYFYLRVIQYLFMSPEPAGAQRPSYSRAVLGASALCLLAVVAIAVFPGWFIGQF